MLTDLLVPQSLPFAIALGLMLIITLTEITGLLLGLAPSSAIDNMLPDIDMDTDADLDGVDASNTALSQVLGWLCIGRVPVLVLFVAFLAAFGLTGLVLQSFFPRDYRVLYTISARNHSCLLSGFALHALSGAGVIKAYAQGRNRGGFTKILYRKSRNNYQR